MGRYRARLAAGSIAALFFAALSALSPLGAAAPSGSVATALQSNERVLYVNAFDEKTRAPITKLDVKDVVVREDGVAREVLRVSPATTPMPVAILVNNTQAANPHIADIRTAMRAFVKTLDGLGPVAIVGVADRPTILRDYTTDQKQLASGVDRIFAMPGAGATLLDAVIETSKGLQKREEDRAALVMLTIEDVEFSTRYYREVLEALTRGGAQMHAVILTTRAGTRLDDASRNRASVFDLGPKESGGTREDVLTSQSFEEKLQQLAGILKNQHRVVYARPQTLIPPEKIEVASAKSGVVASGGPARGQPVR